MGLVGSDYQHQRRGRGWQGAARLLKLKAEARPEAARSTSGSWERGARALARTAAWTARQPAVTAVRNNQPATSNPPPSKSLLLSFYPRSPHTRTMVPSGEWSGVAWRCGPAVHRCAGAGRSAGRGGSGFGQASDRFGSARCTGSAHRLGSQPHESHQVSQSLLARPPPDCGWRGKNPAQQSAFPVGIGWKPGRQRKLQIQPIVPFVLALHSPIPFTLPASSFTEALDPAATSS